MCDFLRHARGPVSGIQAGMRGLLRIAALAVLSLAFCPLLSGCLVAGYSSGSGFWMWPGSIVVTIILVLLYLLTRRH